MAQSQKQHPSFALDDSLFCQEENWESELRQDCTFEQSYSSTCFNDDPLNLSSPCLLTEQDLCWEDDELSTLLSKEEKNSLYETLQNDPSLAMARREAVDWIFRVHSHYSFSFLTALMAVNYFDRFFSSFRLHDDKPWLTQLVAVACLSVAAKVEETHVPLLLDLQVEETKYLFQAKTIQKMEMLVLSTLEWKMNPVTPYSFLDYMIRRLGLKDWHCMEFLRRCEIVLLPAISDFRFMSYLPSAVAVATMLHVISSVEPSIEEYQNQLLGILGINKEKVEECGELILQLALEGCIFLQSNKRKPVSMPGSPNGVIDVSFGSDNSNDSWAMASPSTSSSVCSSPEHVAKKMRVDQDRHLERFNHPSVDSLSILR
ncbi:hypothetical protein V2J09_007500 [Rumex salicifolius]